MRSTRVAAVTVAALLIPLGGCSATDSTSTGARRSATPAAQVARLVLEKSGGIAGVRDTVTVEPDGRWTVVDRSGASRTGQLSAADLERLRQLAADPRLAAETGSTTKPTSCADSFTYLLTVDGTTTGYVDCPTDASRPAATAAVVELLTRATG
ncbi:protealysin inhibitor emfourin [Micromonospora rhizosphaerae]|nr:protealysin inhibitor emfourin [Micromonospora rhizosphaerae]